MQQSQQVQCLETTIQNKVEATYISLCFWSKLNSEAVRPTNNSHWLVVFPWLFFKKEKEGSFFLKKLLYGMDLFEH